MSNQPVVSICIPVYYSGLDVPRVLKELLDSIESQNYTNIQICVSIQETTYEQAMEICEVMATRGILVAMPTAEVDGPAKNTNHAMSLVDGDGYIKIMNQDDFLDSATAISDMVDMLEGTDQRWLVNACIHTDADGQVRERPHTPFWPGEKGMVEGINRFGCPSVVMFHKSIMPDCDPELELCMDCDMWIQLYKSGGAPAIRNIHDVVIRMWASQLSNQINYGRALETDKIYMRKKYGYS